MLEGDSIDAGDPTTITGLLKGDGSALSAAAAGTDYATPEQLDGKPGLYLGERYPQRGRPGRYPDGKLRVGLRNARVC